LRCRRGRIIFGKSGFVILAQRVKNSRHKLVRPAQQARHQQGTQHHHTGVFNNTLAGFATIPFSRHSGVFLPKISNYPVLYPISAHFKHAFEFAQISTQKPSSNQLS
jgi:hypothetical protein